jgi:hypothetical protein
VRAGARILAAVFLLSGAVFFGQGIGVIPGSFMTGRSEWAYIGAALVGIGVLVLWLSRSGPGRA